MAGVEASDGRHCQASERDHSGSTASSTFGSRDGTRVDVSATNLEQAPEAERGTDQSLRVVDDENDGCRASPSGSDEIYAKVIKPSRSKTSFSIGDDGHHLGDDSDHLEDDATCTDRVSSRHGSGGSSSPQMDNFPVVPDPQTDPHAAGRERNEGVQEEGEWQEMALQIGDDLDLEPDPVGDGFRKSSPIPDYEDDRRTVTFTSDTKDNEGQSSRRYPKEGALVVDTPDWTTGTWPGQPTPHPEHDISVSTDRRHYVTLPSTGRPNARLYPGTATVLPPGSVTAMSGNPAAPERAGVWITDTDRWRRNPDNTSVITIDANGDRRSVTNYSQDGGTTPFGIRHGSLNTTGSSTYPTMLVTSSSAHALSKAGLLVNGTSAKYLPPDDSDDVKMMVDLKHEKKKEIEKEKKQKICRITVFAVAMCVVVAVFIGILVKYT